MKSNWYEKIQKTNHFISPRCSKIHYKILTLELLLGSSSPLLTRSMHSRTGLKGPSWKKSVKNAHTKTLNCLPQRENVPSLPYIGSFFKILTMNYVGQASKTDCLMMSSREKSSMESSLLLLMHLILYILPPFKAVKLFSEPGMNSPLSHWGEEGWNLGHMTKASMNQAISLQLSPKSNSLWLNKDNMVF